MRTSPNAFRDEVLERLLSLLWRQWAALGVPGYGDSEQDTVVDPEALLLLTLTVARWDARLFDVALDWLEVNGQFLNVQRLQSVIKVRGYEARAQLSAVAARLGRKSSFAPKWNKLAAAHALEDSESLFFMKDGRALPLSDNHDQVFAKRGLLRAPFKAAGTGKFPAEGMPALLLRLRALIGINVRCEILCVLGSVEEIHPSALAKGIDQSPRTVQNALVEMVRSGVVQVRATERIKSYSLRPGHLDEMLRPSGATPWICSSPLFRALEILWLGLSSARQQALDGLLLASEWRRLGRAMKPHLADSGWGHALQDDGPFRGERYAEVFAEDINRVLARLGV
jgi:hypothetical protein